MIQPLHQGGKVGSVHRPLHPAVSHHSIPVNQTLGHKLQKNKQRKKNRQIQKLKKDRPSDQQQVSYQNDCDIKPVR